MKKGRLSIDEQDFIKKNYRRLSYKELASQLNRDITAVRTYVEKKLGKNITEDEDFQNRAEFDIKRRPYWKELVRQFDESELEILVYHWKKIIAQFKDDVFPTEEIQVINGIKLYIMMDRLLISQHQLGDSIKNLENLLQLEKDAEDDKQDPAFMLDLERQIAVLRSAQDDSSSEFRELLNKQNAIFEALKATRSARIKKLESSKESFISWMTTLLNNSELRKELGQRMEKMRLASELEFKRLSEYHKYVDGTLDQPILSHETLKDN